MAPFFKFIFLSVCTKNGFCLFSFEKISVVDEYVLLRYIVSIWSIGQVQFKVKSSIIIRVMALLQLHFLQNGCIRLRMAPSERICGCIDTLLVFFLFLHKILCCGYSLEALLMSTHNVVLWRNKKKNYGYPLLSGAMIQWSNIHSYHSFESFCIQWVR